jgi:hypothetical protein
MACNIKKWNVTLEDICDHGNAIAARRICFKNQRDCMGKRYYKKDVHLFALADRIYQSNGEIDHQPVWSFIHTDKYSHKKRNITVPSVRDKIIMHMIIEACKKYIIGYDEIVELPVIENGKLIKPAVMKHHDGYLIRHTIASIPDRGTEYGRKCLRHWARTGGSSVKYVVKWDLSKYYDNVDVHALMKRLNRRIDDKRVLQLWWTFLYRKDIGLLIGSPLSQWAANIVFAPVSHWIKSYPGVSHHLQQMDDGIALLSSKRKAERFKVALIEKCHKNGLKIKEVGAGSIRIWRWSDAPIDMIGYRTYRDGFQELRGGIYLTIRRKLDKIERTKHASIRQARSVLSLRGLVKHSDCNELFARTEQVIAKYRLKEIVKNENHNQPLSTVHNQQADGYSVHGNAVC